ncbi:uncharacterized protein LOC132543464 isoform X2 [Ylistrum balloti]|uniref:uncharacterized protein LOC132543464 isoform X2 n=1 Tax=Ylistrum balloti TaxID=509963 RepID=UPI002905D890|nr:uncharacterized protein LOC132543464 isoform X2 [Ylistrum balloti]
MRKIQLRLGIIVLIVLPAYTAVQRDEDIYSRIFSEPCTNRFHPTSRHQKPFLIDIAPGNNGFQTSQLCYMAFTADPVPDENVDNVLVCFKFLQFTFHNCSIGLNVQGSYKEIRYYKPQPPATSAICFKQTTVYVNIGSSDYLYCDPSTRIRIEVTARNAYPPDDRIMSTGNWITVTLLIAVSVIGLLSLGYYKYRYKVRHVRSDRTTSPDSRAPRRDRCSHGRRPSPSALSTMNNDQRMPTVTNGSHRRTNRNRNQRGTSYTQTGTNQAPPVSPDHMRAPPPSYEECIATSGTERQDSGQEVVNDANVQYLLTQNKDFTDDSPPPYPGV